MSDINVVEILNKYLPAYPDKSVRKAVKEIVELVIDKCVKDVKLTEFAQEFMQEGALKAIDKQSILNVKNQISYE